MSRHDELPPADDEPLGRPFVMRPDPSSAAHRRPGAPVTGSPADPWGPPAADPWAAGAAADPWLRAADPWADAVPAVVPPEGDVSGGQAWGGGAEPGPDDVRPYLLTGGRTRAQGPAIAMETIVLATGLRPAGGAAAAGLERRRILELAERPCSAAEVAARLHLPLQVALVLVTDLVAEGLLDASSSERNLADDVVFLERLIAGVAAL